MSAETAAIVAAILAGFVGLAVVVWIASQRVVTALTASSHAASAIATASPVVISLPTSAASNPGAATQPSTSTPTPTDLELRARDQVQDAITAAASEYGRRCTEHRVRGMLEFELAFDAAGVEQSRTVRGFGPGVTEALLACVRKQKLPPLHVQAVGRPITLTANTQL